MIKSANPFRLFTGLDGMPLDQGYVYFGLENQDPETNPISVYWDNAGTQPAAQPLRTVNGYIVRGGTPANVFVNGSAYSLTVKDRNGALQFYERSMGADQVYSFNNRTGAVTLQISDITALGYPPPGANDSGSINVRDYGATGDGVTPDDVAFNNAIAAANASDGKALYIPSGEYLLQQTHDISGLSVFGDQRLFSEDKQSRLRCPANVPLFICNNSRAALHSLAFIGSNNSGHTNNVAFKITASNHVRVFNCDFLFWYTSIQQLGECFYTEYINVRWYNHGFAGFEGIGNTSPGFDSHFADCIMNSTTGTYGFKFTLAGSVTMDTVVITPNGMIGDTVFFESDAALAGVHQLSNCVFESGTTGLYLKGTVSQPIKFVLISNCYIASSTDRAMLIDYGRVRATTCYFTSQKHAVYIAASGDVTMGNCEYQVLEVPIIASEFAQSVTLSVSMPSYAGGYPFIYLPFLPLANVKRVDVLGGDIGQNVDPVALPGPSVPGVRWAAALPLSAVAGVSSFNTRSGAVVLNAGDISGGFGVGSPVLQSSPSTFRSTGLTLPANGKGMELSYDTGTDTGYLVSYDRTAASYKNMSIDSLSLTFNGGDAILLETGEFLLGYLASIGAYKLQVNGDASISGAAFTATPPTPTTGNRVATCDYVIAKIAGSVAGVASFNTRTGAVVLNQADVATAIGTGSTVLSASTMLRATGHNLPASGVGLELSYDPATTASYVVSYNRSTSAYAPLNIDGSGITFKSGQMIIDGSGAVLMGFGSTQGSYKLQVSGDTLLSGAAFATTPSTGTTGTRVATCDYVINRLASASVTSFNTRTGAVTLNSSDVSGAGGALTSGANFSGSVGVASTIRSTGATIPASGVGLEMSWNAGLNASFIVSYDRSASAYKNLNIDADGITFKGGAAIIDGSGQLLVGYLSSNGPYKLQVNSQIFATSATIATSDERVKENITDLEDGLEVIKRLRPVAYDFVEHDVHHFPKARQIGFLAQQLERALDGEDYLGSVVSSQDDPEALKGVAEAKLIPLLVRAVQQLAGRVDALEAFLVVK